MSLRGDTRTAAKSTLIVFARAPEAGRVKTRLVPLLGERGAARLYAQLLERTLQTAVTAGFGSVHLYCASASNGAYFRKVQRRFDVQLRAQGRGNLGDRMHRALRRHPGAVLIGSDCPSLRPADLRAAARALRAGADAVLSPAEDGGYALIGTRRSARTLFDGIEWGSSSVLAQTRARLKRLGWRWKELRTVWDVDRPDDLARLKKSRLLPTRRPTS